MRMIILCENENDQSQSLGLKIKIKIKKKSNIQRFNLCHFKIYKHYDHLHTMMTILIITFHFYSCDDSHLIRYIYIYICLCVTVSGNRKGMNRCSKNKIFYP